jgi:hypothetical protein
MMTRTMLAMVIAFQFLSAPVTAQGASDKDENAHHYSGGPKTEVPHMMSHPRNQGAGPKVHTPTSHHYSGGPKNEAHHMGDKQ